MVRTHPDPPLVCDNRRDSALSPGLHTKRYAARGSALTRLVLTNQWSSRHGVMKQTRPESMGFEKQAAPRCAAYRSPAKGGLAQLGEHLLCKQGVDGSIPSSSTKN